MRDWPSEFCRGARVVKAELPSGYTPPSASVDPAATVTPWPRVDDKPYAQITRVSRWRYRIHIMGNPGAMIETQYGPEGYGWHRYGRHRAERKARRELGRYRARQDREEWTIT